MSAAEPVATIRDIMPKKSVVEALAFVARNLPAIGKDSHSPEGYQYRGIEQITELAGPLLAAEGVVIVPSVRIVSITPCAAMKDGWTDTQVEVHWRVYGPDGSMIEGCTVGIGRDKSDKGSNKAQTQAYKYFLLPLLHIGNKDDDAEAHAPGESEMRDTTPGPDPRVMVIIDNMKGMDPAVRGDVLKGLGLGASPKRGEIVEAIVEFGVANVKALIDGAIIRHKEANREG